MQEPRQLLFTASILRCLPPQIGLTLNNDSAYFSWEFLSYGMGCWSYTRNLNDFRRKNSMMHKLTLAIFALVLMAGAALAADPGVAFPTTSEVSDQKAG